MASRRRASLVRFQSRRRQVAGRRRWLAGGLAAVVLCLSWITLSSGRRALLEAPAYQLVALEVHGLRLLTGAEILAASGLQPGDSIFGVDLDDVAARIDSLVWVREARVERRPPDRLVVTLQERRRTAWLDWDGDLLGLDAHGVVLPRGRLTTEGVADLDLPIIRPQPSDVAPEEAWPEVARWEPAVGALLPDDHEVRALLAWWLRVRQQVPELVPEVSEILSLDAQSLRLRLVADDLEVRLPLYDDDCLRALLSILERVYHDVPNAAYVDLRFRGQAVVGTSLRPTPVRTGTRKSADRESARG